MTAWKRWDGLGPSMALARAFARAAIRLSKPAVLPRCRTRVGLSTHHVGGRKKRPDWGVFVCGGSGGIRTHERLPVAGFQDRCLQPLGHASVAEGILAGATGIHVIAVKDAGP